MEGRRATSKRLGDTLPDALVARLSGRDLAAVADQVILLCTVDPRGFPHLALLSYFEIAATGPSTIRMATYGDSSTTANARREKRVTLMVVAERVAYYIKGTVHELATTMKASPYNAKLEVRIVDVLADEANPELEPGAYIASGLTYVNPQRAAEMDRARMVIAELCQ